MRTSKNIKNSLKRMALGIAITTLLLTCLTISAVAMPPMPASFYGSVQVDGADVADGTVVSAWINGVKYAETITNNSQYTISVPGDDPDTSDSEGGQAGDTIEFKVGDLTASQTGTWQAGSNTQLDLTASTVIAPDLTVTEIKVNGNNPDLDPDAVFVDKDTTVSATIENIGTADANNFDVVLYVNGEEKGSAKASVKKSDSKVVNISWRTPKSIGTYTLKVVADPDNYVPESKENNNEMTKDQYVTENGYMGTKPLVTIANGTVHGGIIYTLGDSKKTKLYEGGTMSVHFDPVLPYDVNKVKIKLARLYTYWYRWKVTTPAELNMLFNGNELTEDEMYTDRKGFGSYDSVSGMHAYDVTDLITGPGQYTATVTVQNNDGEYVQVQGIALLVVYEDIEGTIIGPNITYYIDEGWDALYAKESYGVSPAQATTSAPFMGTAWPPSKYEYPVTSVNAWLFTVVPGGDSKADRLFFNDGQWGNNVWNYSASGCKDCEIAYTNTNVTDYLRSDLNVAQIQDRGDYIKAANAILVLGSKVNYQYEKPEIIIKNAGAEQDKTVKVPITIEGANNVGAMTVNLTYNHSIVNVTKVSDGDFDSIEYNINNTSNYTKISAYQTTNDGLSGKVVIAYVTLKAGDKTCCNSSLNITVDHFEDKDGKTISTYSIKNATFYVACEPLLNATTNVSAIVNDGKDTVNITVNETHCCDVEIDEVTIDLSNIGGDSAAKMKIYNSGYVNVNKTLGTYNNSTNIFTDGEAVCCGAVYAHITDNITDSSGGYGYINVRVNYTDKYGVSNTTYVDTSGYGNTSSTSWQLNLQQNLVDITNMSIVGGNATSGTIEIIAECNYTWTNWTIEVNSSMPLSYMQHNETFTLPITAKNKTTDYYNVKNETSVNIEIVLNGDVDKNGYVDIADAVKIAQYTVGKYSLDDLYKRVADVDCSGDVDISDAMYLAKYIAGLLGFEKLK